MTKSSILYNITVEYLDPDKKPDEYYEATGYSTGDSPKYFLVVLGSGSFAIHPYEGVSCIWVRPSKESK